MDYKQLYESLKGRVIELERHLEKALADNRVLQAEKVQLEVENGNQTRIIQQTIAGMNSNNQEVYEENQRLKEELRQLRGE